MNSIVTTITSYLKLAICSVFIIFQYWVLFYPESPLAERSFHLTVSILLVFLFIPFSKSSTLNRIVNFIFIACAGLVAAYYFVELSRLNNRIENVSSIEWYDIAMAIILTLILIEGVRRTVGNILVAVIVLFGVYGLFGHLLPGGISFGEISLEEWSEILIMTTSGILGVTTATSVNFIFYFIVFGVIYSAVGGGQLFIDLAMKLVGKSVGGGAKVAIIGSSLMGTISGSAVANVTSTGVFTIPLMRKTGIKPEMAAAFEAIASTGGQLMPPIMGIAAFVMAELLVIPYGDVALAGIFPALAFYFSLFIFAHLYAKKTSAGTLTDQDLKEVTPILPRIHMLLPPIVLIIGLVLGLSAQVAVLWATLTCLFAPFLTKQTRYKLSELPKMVTDSGYQAAVIAVPIAAIGIVISVAIQSNLALKFASGLISVGDGSYAISLILVVIGCIIMGMGLPTVAAYIIGAILYVPALKTLGLEPIQAHFFVMYFCVLSMVTPPVSLASFAAAGVAKTDAMKTSFVAFKMCAVAFLIPFAFVSDQALLFQGTVTEIMIAGVGLIFSTIIWAIGLTGYLNKPMNVFERAIMLISGATAMIFSTGSLLWIVAISVGTIYIVFHCVVHKRAQFKALSL